MTESRISFNIVHHNTPMDVSDLANIKVMPSFNASKM
jgi:hypothetical protein